MRRDAYNRHSLGFRASSVGSASEDFSFASLPGRRCVQKSSDPCRSTDKVQQPSRKVHQQDF